MIPGRKIPIVILSVFLLAVTTQSRAAEPQYAEVTFYSNGSIWTIGLPGSKHGYFDGAIFDGQQRIAGTRHGRFITLKLAPGLHTFSASYSGKHPAENSHLALDLVEGKSYFVRAEQESSGVVLVEFRKGRLDLVTCAVAHQEADKTLALEEKHVSAAMKSSVVATTSIPICR